VPAAAVETAREREVWVDDRGKRRRASTVSGGLSSTSTVRASLRAASKLFQIVFVQREDGDGMCTADSGELSHTTDTF
jgi:hypothetical protein